MNCSHCSQPLHCLSAVRATQAPATSMTSRVPHVTIASWCSAPAGMTHVATVAPPPPTPAPVTSCNSTAPRSSPS